MKFSALNQRATPEIDGEVFIWTGARSVMSYLTRPIIDQVAQAFRER